MSFVLGTLLGVVLGHIFGARIIAYAKKQFGIVPAPAPTDAPK